MKEFIKKYILTIIIGTITISLGLINYYKTTQSEIEFNYTTKCISDYLNLNEFNSGIDFNIDGTNYKDICVTHIDIRNVGSFEIRISDFMKQPIVFQDTGKSEFIKIENFEANKGFQPNVYFKSDSLIIDPILIKLDDWMSFDIISKKGTTAFDFRSRLDGLKPIEVYGRLLKPKLTKYPILKRVANGGAIFLIGFLFFIIFLGRYADTPEGGIPSLKTFYHYRPNNRTYIFVGFWVLVELSILIVLLVLDKDSTDGLFYLMALGLGFTAMTFFNFEFYGVLRSYKEKTKEEINDAWSKGEKV